MLERQNWMPRLNMLIALNCRVVLEVDQPLDSLTCKMRFGKPDPPTFKPSQAV